MKQLRESRQVRDTDHSRIGHSNDNTDALHVNSTTGVSIVDKTSILKKAL